MGVLSFADIKPSTLKFVDIEVPECGEGAQIRLVEPSAAAGMRCQAIQEDVAAGEKTLSDFVVEVLKSCGQNPDGSLYPQEHAKLKALLEVFRLRTLLAIAEKFQEVSGIKEIAEKAAAQAAKEADAGNAEASPTKE